MNIYEKLQECRAKLKGKDLKKTGFNKFSNYTYFELGDFLPYAIDIMTDLKMTSLFGFFQDKATLTIINTEKIDETILFETPSIIPEMKGSNAIQSIGAAQTYMRRYLYTMALELSESDIVNLTNPHDEEVEKQAILNRKINEIELEAFQQAVEETDTDIDALFKILKYVGTPEDLTFGNWKEAMAKIETKKEKMKKSNAKKLEL